MRLFIRCLTIAFMLSIAATRVYGDTGPGDGTAERIHSLQRSLDDRTGSARLWWYGWAGFYAGATIVSLTAALTSGNRTLQITSGVSAAESFVGLSGMLILPFAAKDAAAELRDMPEATPEERSKKLLAAEELLQKSAEDEAAGRSWVQHMLGVLVNAAGALVLWQGYGSKIRQAGGEPWEQALLSFVAGTAVSELQIWTEPTGAMAAYKDYRSTFPTSPASTHTSIDTRFLCLPSRDGLEIAVIARF